MKRMLMGLVFAVILGCVPIAAGASESGIPVGGITILKTDVAGKPLEGACFQIARELQDGEMTDRGIEKKLLKIGAENRIMAMVPFWAARTMDGEKQKEIITNAEGKAEIYGLSYGTYYLVETKAPEGYNRITSPIRVTVHKYSHLTQKDNVRDDQNVVIDNTLHIINVRYAIPNTGTGSLETVQLAAAGTGIVFSTISLLLLMNRRRW